VTLLGKKRTVAVFRPSEGRRGAERGAERDDGDAVPLFVEVRERAGSLLCLPQFR